MEVLYITNCFESVQKHLVEALNDSGICARMFYYKISHGLDEELLSYVHHYNPQYVMKGPLFYVTRLKLAARYALANYNLANYTILHGNMMFSDGIVCRYLSHNLGIPYVLSVRDTDINSWFSWKWPWIRTEGVKNLKEAKKVIFISKPYKEKLLNLLHEERLRDDIDSKSIIIPNGIDRYFIENKRKKELNKGTIRVIYIGKLEKRKNFELTVKAVKLLQKEGIDINLTAVGDIIDDEYQKLIDGNDFVSHFAKCDMEHVVTHLRKADIFVMPSHTETFGLVYAEAMSQGVPVLYTKGQGFDQQFEDGIVGYSVSDIDCVELANSIKKVISNYSELSSNCVSLVNTFDWRNISERLKSAYYE